MSLPLCSPSRYTPDCLVSELSSERPQHLFLCTPAVAWLRLLHLSGTVPDPAISSVHSVSPLFSNHTLQAQTIFKPCYRREPASSGARGNQSRDTCPHLSPTRQRLWCSAYRCLLQSPWPSFSHRGSMINLWWNEWLICRKQFKLIRSGMECHFLS